MAYNTKTSAIDVDLSYLQNRIQDAVISNYDRAAESLKEDTEGENKESILDKFAKDVADQVIDLVKDAEQEKRLNMLYNHEKQYLDILKDYKEEIKFATSIQADVRKEQAQFFSSTLKEVCNALKETQVDPKCQVQWIFDLVQSYTSSLKISSQLTEEHVISLIGEINDKANKVINPDK